ncbi:DUF4397 domain-containing protein [Mucilaginibacter terrae]|uniref:DUF4397 domain-containing protein n=1 Tax=Mucilaginibacter terrae TaxID=1955052 RepID=A0ABU3GTG9_9SPHI|nr:DUF4397 domain-containing protein [Mucilaginibacter terrae]MDT3403083.1 hypothetical protein [Mucilaginibacter terrae]
MPKHLRLTCLLAAFMLALAACVKNDAPVPTPGTVNLNVINAVTDTAINYYINGARQNSVTGIYPLSANGYTSVNIGQTTIAFRRLFDNQNYNYADTLFTLPVKLDSVGSGVRYSLFIGGLTRSTAFMIKDTLESDSKNAMLRFVQASPSVKNMRVYLNDTLRFTTNSFKAISKFIAVGNGKKVLKVTPVNTNDVLYTSNVTLTEGRIYTLFSQGRQNNFRVGLIINQ